MGDVIIMAIRVYTIDELSICRNQGVRATVTATHLVFDSNSNVLFNGRECLPAFREKPVHYPMGSTEYAWCWLECALCTMGSHCGRTTRGPGNQCSRSLQQTKRDTHKKKQRDPGKGRSRSVTSPRFAGRARVCTIPSVGLMRE